MPGKSNFVDYEPLSNSRRARAPEGEEFGVYKPVGVESGSEPIRHTADDRSKEVSEVNAAKVMHANSTSLTRTALRRGHGLSFIGLFLFTMLVFFRPYEFSPWLAWLSKGALITAIATLVFFVPTQLGLENRLSVRTREVNLVLLLLLLCLISVPFALDKLQAWNSFVDFLKVVVMFVVMVNVIRTEKRLKALLLLILVATVILSVAAVNDYRMGNLALGGQRIEGAIGSLFDNPNDLALHLVTFFPIVIGLALGSRYFAAKTIYLLVAVCILGGTVVTFSRAGFLGLIFVFGTLAWKLGPKNRFLVGVIAVVLITLFLILAPGAYRQRVTTTGDESAQARTGELKRSIFLAIRNPVFGVGMGNFVLFSDKEHATHNAYTQVASEIGLPATIVYVLFLLAAFQRVRRMPSPYEVEKRKRAVPYLAVGLQASLVGYMVVSFFASVAYLWYVYYLVGYAVCLSRLYYDSQVRQKVVVE
ncbi:MAG TPA: O-antigen ligase family protein, partial [Pyrinomonadaceae bacterium]|nr:O-antigen ligase family protein [Pyrinomonadaceae bacterium]